MSREIAGIVLAGGQSRRMGGGDKGLLDLGGRPVIAHVIERLGCARAISANGDPARFADFGLPVLPDSLPDWPGPLAGVLAGMDWAAARGIPRIVTAAADTPFFPRDLAARLAGVEAPVIMASNDGDHPAFALWDVSLRDDLRAALHSGTRRMRDWMDAHGAVRVGFPGDDPFFNINTPAELATARLRLSQEQEWT
ncbi:MULTISPECIES: molybdenum cofactor guanylyltransferase MobA [unclassified Paracoccus (in: a-proteobacteria)]|uniref:molybdenum cofactor guanylyltransferase MobA n=1 Tax=unclassified Paracoccus (in: a-proteobacteria) TaxID=2688777 RepID=UPI0015FFAE8F|nr:MULTISPECIES: molybdenum cofactor guanylyltransferase MobA [unclassified Paracoccus (in: a-proteobacteria)]MBB1491536.1 molybdenum cofactor guanylyltransferase MobA [Paracoccus sp. MC1854]MBB1497579.1 molybdenum cofactor guanylyltransferase MobA [Paracoccus sp. MC1862]QQO44028.1 molybdenum cofactor guanylyltransferase MobA [Paracoccus sp. MC1862]